MIILGIQLHSLIHLHLITHREPNTLPPPPSRPSQHSAILVLNKVDPKLMSDPATSTTGMTNTPPETVATDLMDDRDPFGGPIPSSSSVPWPGSTFIIRSVSSGQVITLLDGQIVLAPPGGRGSIHWACV